jgi:predicted permease
MNLKHAFRSIRKNPLVTTMAILSLALGIGANTAIFSLIDQLLLRMLPVETPQQLVQLASRSAEIGATWGDDRMSYPMYRDFRDKADAFSGMLAWYATPASLGYGGRTELVRSELVSGDYFKVLGVNTEVGNTFSPENQERTGAEPYAVLTYDFWQSRFAGDPKIIGQKIQLNGYPITIIGVGARGFRGLEIGDATQVFVPIVMQRQISPILDFGPFSALEVRRSRWISVFARLKPGVTIRQAQASIAPLYKQIVEMEVQEPPFQRASENRRQEYLASHMDVFDGSTGRSPLRELFAKPLYVLMALTGLVLLIACANVASLLIARATARRKEIAVRLALGASRMQIVGQLMVESLLLSAAAAAAGLGIGLWMNRFLLQFIPTDNLLTISAALDFRVLTFSLVIAAFTAFIFGLAPALQAARPQLLDTLKNEAGSIFGARGHARARKALVIAQVSLSLLLLIVSALFVRSLSNLHGLDPGFRADHVITFSIDPSLNGYTPERTTQLYRDLLTELRAASGVTAAGLGVRRVLDNKPWRNGVTIEGHTSQDENVFTYFNMVSSRYFDTLRIPLLAGRDFDERDAANPQRVCIINETFARKFFQGGLAVGRHIGMGVAPGTQTNIEIIGVVRDSKYDNLRSETPIQMFVPMRGNPGTVVYVRTGVEPVSLFGTIRSIVQHKDPDLPIFAMRTMEDQVDRNLITERMIATLSSAFGTLATLLALIGLYGVMSFVVTQRTREIGIRVSLGARGTHVLGMMMREVVFVMLSGIAIAIPIYVALASYMRSQLYGIEPTDPFYIGAAGLFLLAIGLLAGYIPSRRALRVDPIRVLRYE